MLAALFSPGPDPWARDPARAWLERDRNALERRLRKADAARDKTARALESSEQEKDLYLSEYEAANARAATAERQTRAAEQAGAQRVRTLDAQLRRHGHIPHPDDWKELAGWCQEELAEELELRPGAVRGIKKAEFEDLWLVAECLVWLARTYRDYRRTAPGRTLDIRNDVDSRLSDGPAPRSVEFPDWDAVPRHERRNISRGARRDRRSCLRIYYHWDADAEKVVVVSMPAHADAS